MGKLSINSELSIAMADYQGVLLKSWNKTSVFAWITRPSHGSKACNFEGSILGVQSKRLPSRALSPCLFPSKIVHFPFKPP